VRRAVIALAVIGFLAVSTLVARWLTTDNAERDQVTQLLSAQLRDDPRTMLRRLHGCTGACAAQVVATARRLRRPGPLQIVAYDSATAHSLWSNSGPTRVVWKTPTTLTVVQCVGVRRTGDALRGLSIRLLTLSPSRPRTSGC
jgi:hypothetical protein